MLKRLQQWIKLRLVPRVRPCAVDFAMQVPFDYAASYAPPKVAAVCHIYYPDLARQMRCALENVPGAELFVSTDSAEKADAIQRAFAGWTGGLDVRVVPNRGRDIAPKFVTFRDVYAQHDLVLFLHSKKTAVVEHGDSWRQTLFADLAGSPETVRSIIDAFAADPSLGMVVPQHFEPIRKYLPWAENYPIALPLAERMDIELWKCRWLDFAAGSMYWARPAALIPMLNLQLDYADFSEERGQVGGTLAHAIERLMLHVCEKAGFRWLKVADAGAHQYHENIVRIESREALARFALKHGVSLR